MRHSFMFRALLAILLVSAAQAQTIPAGLTGTWVLVEQTYGKGGSSLVDSEAPIRIRITPTESGVSAWIWRGDDASTGSAWPAMVAEGRALRVVARSVQIEAAGTTLHAKYEVVPVEGEDLVLEINESYTLAPDGLSLAGTVAVRFKGGDTHRGGYALYRRFEREK